MNHYRLDAGPSSLVVDCRDGALQLCYLGSVLPGGLDLAELSLLTSSPTPHGELDGKLERSGFPTQDGYSQAQAALLARRHGRALLIRLRVVQCASSEGMLAIDLQDSQAQVHVRLTITGSASGVFTSTSAVSNTASDTSLE
ncbi:MAG: alpha-galactosidase, partial [Congregibacter sp.]|nr:alpha-galactosidase [Congregibacter sp.]